jgi:hypothetical protein
MHRRLPVGQHLSGVVRVVHTVAAPAATAGRHLRRMRPPTTMETAAQ